jgi:hypothetical protein
MHISFQSYVLYMLDGITLMFFFHPCVRWIGILPFLACQHASEFRLTTSETSVCFVHHAKLVFLPDMHNSCNSGVVHLAVLLHIILFNNAKVYVTC